MAEVELRKANGNLQRLRQILEEYRAMPGLVGPPVHGVSKLMLDSGEGTIEGLLKCPDVAVVDSLYKPHSKFPYHQHDEQEYFIVYCGKLWVDLSGDIKELVVGDSIHIKDGLIHKVWTEDEGCKFIVVTVPANEHFPDVDK